VLKFGRVGTENSVPVSAYHFTDVSGLVEYSVGLFSIVYRVRDVFYSRIVKEIPL